MPPVAAFKANMCPCGSDEQPNTTPLAPETAPWEVEPVGFGVCHRMLPVAGSSALQNPAFVNVPVGRPVLPALLSHPEQLALGALGTGREQGGTLTEVEIRPRWQRAGVEVAEA